MKGVELTGHGKLVVTESADGSEAKSEYDEILVATGRKPSIDHLDLLAAGIVSGKRGMKLE